MTATNLYFSALSKKKKKKPFALFLHSVSGARLLFVFAFRRHDGSTPDSPPLHLHFLFVLILRRSKKIESSKVFVRLSASISPPPFPHRPPTPAPPSRRLLLLPAIHVGEKKRAALSEQCVVCSKPVEAEERNSSHPSGLNEARRQHRGENRFGKPLWDLTSDLLPAAQWTRMKPVRLKQQL